MPIISVPYDVINNLNEKKSQVEEIYKKLDISIIETEKIVNYTSDSLNEKKNIISKLEEEIKTIIKQLFDINKQIKKYNDLIKVYHNKINFCEQQKLIAEKSIQKILS